MAMTRIARRVLGAEPKVRDPGLLESAVARPRASVFGDDAATIAFYGMNGMHTQPR